MCRSILFALGVLVLLEPARASSPPSLSDLAGTWCLVEAIAINRPDEPKDAYAATLEIASPDTPGARVTTGSLHMTFLPDGNWARQSLDVQQFEDGSLIAWGTVEETGHRGWSSDTLGLMLNEAGELAGRGVDTQPFLYDYRFSRGACLSAVS